MPMSGAAAKARRARDRACWQVSDARWRDVPAMLNIVVAAAAEGFFSAAFLDVRYQIGLALQFFSVLLRGRMAVPGQVATRARVRVVRCGPDVLGFSLVRVLPGVLVGAHQELHLLVVRADVRGSGVGQALLQDAVSRLAHGQCLLLSTLPQADGMKRLVRRMGARSLGVIPSAGAGQRALTAHVFDPTGSVVWQHAPWRAWLMPAHDPSR